MDALANLKAHWKPAAIVLGGGALLFVAVRMLGGGGGAAPSVPTATGADAGATAAQLASIGAAASAQQQQTNVNLAAMDAQTYATTIQAHAQVGATAIAAASQLQLGSIQALTSGFSNFVVATAQEASAAGTAAARLGQSNNESTSRNIAAFGGLLAGAGALVGSVTGAGLTRFNGLPSSGFAGIGGTNIPIVLMPANSGLVRQQP